MELSAVLLTLLNEGLGIIVGRAPCTALGLTSGGAAQRYCVGCELRFSREPNQFAFRTTASTKNDASKSNAAME